MAELIAWLFNRWHYTDPPVRTSSDGDNIVWGT